jgi:hypothetical protein
VQPGGGCVSINPAVMEYSDRPRSGVQPVSTGRERSSSFRDDEWDRDKEDTTSETSSKSDEDSEVSSDDRPLTLEDRALAAKMAADVALDRDTDAEAIAAYDTIASRRRRTAFGAFSSIFAVPTQVLDKVYKNRNSLLTFHPRSEIRLACDRLMKNQHFEMVIFGCVLVNGLVIGLQKPEAQMNAGASAILPETLSTTLQVRLSQSPRTASAIAHARLTLSACIGPGDFPNFVRLRSVGEDRRVRLFNRRKHVLKGVLEHARLRRGGGWFGGSGELQRRHGAVAVAVNSHATAASSAEQVQIGTAGA